MVTHGFVSNDRNVTDGSAWRLFVLVCLVISLAGCSSTRMVKVRPRSSPPADPIAVPFAKISRGATNIVKAPLDVPATVYRKVKQSNGIIGFGTAVTTGAAEGVLNGGIRALAGGAEILSFPLIYDSKPFYQRQLGESAFRRWRK